MLVVRHETVLTHDPQVEVHRGQVLPAFENADRVRSILSALQADDRFQLVDPDDFETDVLQRVHSGDYIEFIRTAHDEWQALGAEGHIVPHVWPSAEMTAEVPDSLFGKLGYYSFDAGTTISAGTWETAWASAKCAMSAAKAARDGGTTTFALCRPPGHHAEASRFGGYCFLNTAALAAEQFRHDGSERVAILDVDYHHGNGTQSIFYERPDVLTISIHADPKTAYPYFCGYEHETGRRAGEGTNRNFCLPDGTDWARYEPTLNSALDVIRDFQPDSLIVPFGADTFEDDPISGFRLQTSDFATLGTRIAEVGLPTTVVMEGGYAIEALGRNVANFLQSLA